MSKGQLIILDVNLLLPEEMIALQKKINEDSGQKVSLDIKALFAGQMDEETFWRELQLASAVDDYTVNSWREWLGKNLLPNSEVKHLEGWRKKANVGLSANFFAPWLRRALKTADVLRHFKYTWISSETGQVKPEDPDVFTAAFALGLEILYIDQQEENLKLAEGYGFTALRADPGWPGAVNLWLD